MGLMDKFRGFFGPDEEEYDNEDSDYVEEDPEPQPETSSSQYSGSRSNTVPLKSKVRGRIVVKTPESFEDGKGIADLLKQRNAVVFNVELLSREEGTRLIDFLGGASYMSDAELKYTGNMTFLIAPRDMDVVVQVPNSDQANVDFFL